MQEFLLYQPKKPFAHKLRTYDPHSKALKTGFAKEASGCSAELRTHFSSATAEGRELPPNLRGKKISLLQLCEYTIPGQRPSICSSAFSERNPQAKCKFWAYETDGNIHCDGHPVDAEGFDLLRLAAAMENSSLPTASAPAEVSPNPVGDISLPNMCGCTVSEPGRNVEIACGCDKVESIICEFDQGNSVFLCHESGESGENKPPFRLQISNFDLECIRAVVDSYSSASEEGTASDPGTVLPIVDLALTQASVFPETGETHETTGARKYTVPDWEELYIPGLTIIIAIAFLASLVAMSRDGSGSGEVASTPTKGGDKISRPPRVRQATSNRGGGGGSAGKKSCS